MLNACKYNTMRSLALIPCAGIPRVQPPRHRQLTVHSMWRNAVSRPAVAAHYNHFVSTLSHT